MSEIVKRLKMFNAKERYFLLAYAQDQEELKLGPFFRGQLSQKIGVVVPEDAFVAMDYHLDWLYAALHLAVQGGEGPFKNHHEQVDDEKKWMIQGQQEDADLLIAFDLDGVTQLILIEVKGVTSWGNDQLQSKARRLKQIFHDDGKRWVNVQPYFVLMSPRQPGYASPQKDKGLKITNYPRWMKANESESAQQMLNWLPLPISDMDQIKKVTRCNEHNGDYKDWKIVSR